ncbi:tRNA-histidine guanylyltransferase 1-like [Aspergillus nanangensis]|uniref:tRNA-histidine guanylyltransferase 1-like n=1 Tax=Aspergillus nanangensis TaxID=2582783 RepID=A0AAD4CEM1_ASPNN|nr:tRNA-histidine guanylyltransferase 1-like [Aspergillus nanangensis]
MSKHFSIYRAFPRPFALPPIILSGVSRLPRRNYYTEEDQSTFLGSFLENHQPPQSTVDHFSSLAWTRKILQDERYEIVPFFPRHFNARTGENRFFAQTVNTATTIPHVLSLQRKDLRLPSGDETSAAVELPTRPDVLCLMALGRDLEEHPSIVHGGFQAVLFDEIMRFVVLLHHNRHCEPGPRNKHYTVNMSLSYRAPLIAQSDVFLRSRLVRREGRKWFTEAEIVDGSERVLTVAESTWVTTKSSIA